MKCEKFQFQFHASNALYLCHQFITFENTEREKNRVDDVKIQFINFAELVNCFLRWNHGAK